jgi:hypothetical protein
MVQKSFLRSRTFWLNFLSAVIAAFAIMFPSLQPVLDFMKAHVAEIGMIWSLANMVLRFVTHEKIGLSD